METAVLSSPALVQAALELLREEQNARHGIAMEHLLTWKHRAVAEGQSKVRGNIQKWGAGGACSGVVRDDIKCLHNPRPGRLEP